MVLVDIPECGLLAWVATEELAAALIEAETGVVVA